MKLTVACLLVSLALAASEASNADKNLRRSLQFGVSTPMPAPTGGFGGEPSPMGEDTFSGGGSDQGGDGFPGNSPTVDEDDTFGDDDGAGNEDDDGAGNEDDDGADNDAEDFESSGGNDIPVPAPTDAIPGLGQGGINESPSIGGFGPGSESETGNNSFGSFAENNDGGDDEDEADSPTPDFGFETGEGAGNDFPATGSSPFDGEEDDDETPSPTPTDDDASSGLGDESFGTDTPSPTSANNDNGPTFGGGGSGPNNMPTWGGTPAPSASSNDIPFMPSWNSPPSSASWDWRDSTIEDLEHDRTAIAAISVSLVIGILLAIFTAHQMLQNPRGCCASICRILVACTCGITRCICYPCRAVCGCTGKPERRTHERMLAQDVDYANDLELS